MEQRWWFRMLGMVIEKKKNYRTSGTQKKELKTASTIDIKKKTSLET